MKKAYIAAFLIIGMAIGFTMWAFSSNMTPYVDIRTAKKIGSSVQVRGKILHETARYDSTLNALRFEIEDVNKERIEVVYRGGKPEAFDTAPETAAHGMVRRDAGGALVFESDRLVVKCPSKYDEGKKNFYKQARASGG